MNKLARKALQQLELLKDSALVQTNEQFPEKFYSVAEFFLTNSSFKSAIYEIDQEWNEDYFQYREMGIGILRLIEHIYSSIVRYVQGKQITVQAVVDIEFLANAKGEGLVEIFKKAWAVERICEQLPEHQHGSFVSELRQKVNLLKKKLEDIGEESNRLREIEKGRSWGYLRRFRGIVSIYNVKKYKGIREQLVESDEGANLLSLDVRFQGLSKCIYPEKEALSYDENFGMQDDKIAIQKIYAFAEQELRQAQDSENTSGGVDKKIRVVETKEKQQLRIFVAEQEKNPISGKSNRGKLAQFFSKKKKCHGEQLFGVLMVETTEDVEKSIKDFNKLFNGYGIKAALKMRDIKSNFSKKIEVTRNPQYWE